LPLVAPSKDVVAKIGELLAEVGYGPTRSSGERMSEARPPDPHRHQRAAISRRGALLPL
jgi:hypothetical protein